MKKLIALALSLLLVASLFAACGGNGGEIGAATEGKGGNTAINTEIPDGNTALQKGDIVVIVSEEDREVHQLNDIFE